MLIVAAGIGAAPVSAQDDKITILALGDSLTAGFGLPQDQGFVPQLQAWLNANGAPQAQVLNAGVSGDTTAGGRARLAWAIGDGVDAAIVELGANDALRGLPPSETRANLDAILTELTAQNVAVLLSGMIGPQNYGPDYKTAFDAVFPDMAAKHGAIYDPFFLEGVVGDPALNQDDRIHPNAEGVAIIVARLGPLVLELIERVGAAAAE